MSCNPPQHTHCYTLLLTLGLHRTYIWYFSSCKEVSCTCSCFNQRSDDHTEVGVSEQHFSLNNSMYTHYIAITKLYCLTVSNLTHLHMVDAGTHQDLQLQSQLQLHMAHFGLRRAQVQVSGSCCSCSRTSGQCSFGKACLCLLTLQV